MERKKKEVKIENLTSENYNCKDKDCPYHGFLKTRGRVFEGVVTRKFPRRIAIEFERFIYVRKYERFMKRKTRIHARLPRCFENKIEIGDIVQVQECRPLSKMIHHVLIKKIKSKNESNFSKSN
jgi:small subunit ribosomal protein S17